MDMSVQQNSGFSSKVPEVFGKKTDGQFVAAEMSSQNIKPKKEIDEKSFEGNKNKKIRFFKVQKSSDAYDERKKEGQIVFSGTSENTTKIVSRTVVVEKSSKDENLNSNEASRMTSQIPYKIYFRKFF